MKLVTLRGAVELEELYKAYQQTFDPTGKVYILIDETQYIDEWERFVLYSAHFRDT